MKKIFDLALNYFTFVFLIIIALSTAFLVLFIKERVVIAFLQSYTLWNIGVRNLIAFGANTIPQSAQAIASSYDWQKSTSMQRELAADSAALALLGFLSLSFKGFFWFAAILSGTVGCIIAETGNLINIYRKGRHPYARKKQSPYKVSPPLFFGMHVDWLLSLIVLIIGICQLSFVKS